MKKTANLLAGLIAGFALTAQAQNFPTKPIRLVVPFAPGGSSSIVARSVAAEMEKGLGQPIIIDNKPGGGGNVAMIEVAKADPDGYTLIIGHVGSLAMNPFMYTNLPYDVVSGSDRVGGSVSASGYFLTGTSVDATGPTVLSVSPPDGS